MLVYNDVCCTPIHVHLFSKFNFKKSYDPDVWTASPLKTL